MLTPMVFYKSRTALNQQRATTAENVRHYVLEVTFNVNPSDLDDFARQSAALVPTFAKLKLNVKNSAWVEEGGRARVFNYWDLGPDANQLLVAELALPDIPRFNTFNIIVREEVKNLVIPLAVEEVVPLPFAKGVKLSKNDYHYLRVECTVSNAYFSEFVARVEGYMARFTHRAKWFLGDTYYGVTGKEGTVSQLWIVPGAALPGIDATLSAAPWLRDGIASNISARALQAAPADPIFG